MRTPPPCRGTGRPTLVVALPLLLLVAVLLLGGVASPVRASVANAPSPTPQGAVDVGSAPLVGGPRPAASSATVLDTISTVNDTVLSGGHEYSGLDNPVNVTAGGDRVAVVGEYSGNALLLNPSSGQIVTSANAGLDPIAAVYDPLNGNFYVLDSYGGINEIDPTSGAVLATFPFSVTYLNAIAFDPVQNVLIVSSGTAYSVSPQPRDAVWFLNPATGAVLGSQNVGVDPSALAVAPALDRVFVGNNASANLSVVSTTTYALLATYAFPCYPSAIAYDPAAGDVLGLEFGLNSVYVVNATTGAAAPSVPVDLVTDWMTYDGAAGAFAVTGPGAQGDSLVLVGAQNLTAGAPVGILSSNSSLGPIGYSPYGAHLFALNPTLNDALTLDATSFASVASASFGSLPDGAAVDSENGDLYVANDLTDTVTVIDLATQQVLTTVPVGTYPIAVAYDNASGLVYVSTYNTGEYVIDPSTQNVVAEVTPGTLTVWLAYDPVDQDLFEFNEPNIGLNGNVTVLNGATGATLAITPVDGCLTQYGVVDLHTGAVYVDCDSVTGATNLTEINPTSFAVGTSLPLPSYVEAMGFDPGNGLLTVSEYVDGAYELRFVDPGNGTIVATLPGVGNEGPAAWLPGPQVFAIPSTGANLLNLFVGGSTVPTIWTIVGQSPIAATLDPATGTVYVVNDLGSSVEAVAVVNTPDALSVAVDPASCGPVGLAGAPANATVSVATGEYSLTAPACYGHAFADWTTSGSVAVVDPTSPSTDAFVNGSGQITASYAVAPGARFGVGVVVEPSGCGNAVDVAGTSYGNQTTDLLVPGTYAVTAATCAGYAFVGWQVVGALALADQGPQAALLNVSGNGTITAEYAPAAVPPSPSSSSGYSAMQVLLLVAAGAIVGGLVGGVLGGVLGRPPRPRPPEPAPTSPGLPPPGSA
jgi:YVTN family beta-propeller protein